MKRKLKGLGAVIAAFVLMAALIIPASGSPSIYLMAVNETMHEMTAENMPILSDGVLYVPYTLLSQQHTGVKLDVRSQYNTTRRTLVVTNGKRTVTFNTQTNTVQTTEGPRTDVRAITRNAMVFVPIFFLCDYFPTLNCSLLPSPWGTLVRVTNGDAILSDDEFMGAADIMLEDNYNKYMDSLSGTSPSLTPTPSTPPSPSPTPEQPDPVVCLAFRAGSATGQAAALVEKANQQALFLFAPHELAENDDLIRGLLGRGHSVGLVLEGEDPAACLEQLDEGRRLLAEIARCPAIIAAAPGLNEEGLAQVAEQGCALWRATHYGEGRTALSLLNRLRHDRVNYVELPCGSGDMLRIEELLLALTGMDYDLLLASPPEL